MTVEVQEIQEVKSHWSGPASGLANVYRPWPRGVPGVQGDLGLLRNHAAAVGIPLDTYPFPQVQASLDRAAAWDRVAWESCGTAQRQLNEARARALTAPTVTVEALDAYVDVRERLRAWTQYEEMRLEAALPGKERRVMLAAKELAELEKQKAGVLYVSTLPLYSIFARKAAEAVEQVAAILPLPDRVWGAMEPTAVLAPEPLAVLQAADRAFNICHFVGRYLRAMGVEGTGLQGADILPGGEPPMALTFRRWAEASSHHHELRTIRQPLKLAYVVKNNWQPGLWTKDDLAGVDQGPARRNYVPAFMVR